MRGRRNNAKIIHHLKLRVLLDFDRHAWRRGNYLLLCLILFWLILWIPAIAHGRDLGQWSDQPPHVRQWFNTLKQPDTLISCCGEADAVEADEWVVRPDGSVDATVTNGRGYVLDGVVIHVPPGKVVVGRENPTGHSILFLSSGGAAYCFVPNGGV